MEGLGDLIDEFTTRTGIKVTVKRAAEVAHSIGIKDTPDCGCQKRKEALNKAVPFNNKQ